MTDASDEYGERTEREPFWKRRDLTLPPTEIGEEWDITVTGADEAKTAVSAVRAAFSGCWGEKALELEDEYGGTCYYTYQGSSPIFLSHIPSDSYDPEAHGELQTMGIRYSYQFIRVLDATETVRVVAWEDTRFSDVSEDEVMYP